MKKNFFNTLYKLDILTHSSVFESIIVLCKVFYVEGVVVPLYVLRMDNDITIKMVETIFRGTICTRESFSIRPKL